MICNKTSVRFWAVYAGAVSLLLSGCITSPELEINAAPVDPVSARHFGALASDHPEASALVRQALEARGGFAAEDGWRVQTTMAVRPATVGAYSDAPARNGQWSEVPRVSGARRGTQLHVLSVVLEQTGGTEQRVVQVSARSDEIETPPELLATLAKAAAVAAYEGREAALAEKRPSA